MQIDLKQELDAFVKTFTNPWDVIKLALNDELLEKINSIIVKITNLFNKAYIDETQYHSFLSTLFKYKPSFLREFYDKLDLKVLKAIIDVDLYYRLLKHKYSDLDHFLEQFWSKIKDSKNLDKNSQALNIEEYENLQHKDKYAQMLKMLKEDLNDVNKKIVELK